MNRSVYQLIVSMSKYCTIPNMLTLIRLLLTPFIIGHLCQAMWLRAMLLFIVAGITDFLDGYIARLTLTQTDLGRLLDPIADKILIVGVIGALVFGCFDILKEQSWLFWFLASKELMLIIGSVSLWLKGSVEQVRPHVSGKIAMTVQLGGILLLFATIIFDCISAGLINAVSWIIVSVNVVALIFYGKAFLFEASYK